MKLDVIKYGGLGLGVGAALCQVLVHNLPYLTLSYLSADFYTLNEQIGTFSINAISGFLYSVFIVFTYCKLYEIIVNSTINIKGIVVMFIICLMHLIMILSTGFSSLFVNGVYIQISIMAFFAIISCILFHVHVCKSKTNLSKEQQLKDQPNQIENGSDPMIDENEYQN